MIELSGVSKRFGDIDALADVSFTVPQGHVIGFLGANGAGKTTTMDIICGVTGADNGTVRICGHEIAEEPRAAKQKLGYLPDEPPLHNDMRVEQFINYAAKLRGVSASDLTSRVETTIEKLSLQEVRHRLIGNLSKGYRQRVGLAQALIHNPEVLVLDEPTEGLDPNQIVQIRDLIKSLRGEHTIIFSSHILSEVESICDEIVIIDKGRIIEQGPYEQLVRKIEAGRRYYLRVAQNASDLNQKLSQVRGISHPILVDQERQVLEFSLSEESGIVDDIARLVLNGNYGLRELGLKSKSLEEVFFQLTGQ